MEKEYDRPVCSVGRVFDSLHLIAPVTIILKTHEASFNQTSRHLCPLVSSSWYRQTLWLVPPASVCGVHESLMNLHCPALVALRICSADYVVT